MYSASNFLQLLAVLWCCSETPQELLVSSVCRVRVCVCLLLSAFPVFQAQDHMTHPVKQWPVSSTKAPTPPSSFFGTLLVPLPSCRWTFFFFILFLFHYLRTMFYFFLPPCSSGRCREAVVRRLPASLSPSEWLELTCHSVFVAAAPAGPRSPRRRRAHISARMTTE